MRAILSILFICFTLSLSAQGYFEVQSCKVEQQVTYTFSSAAMPVTTEGYVLIDLDYWTFTVKVGKEVLSGNLGEEYSVPGPEKSTTLFYWVIEEGLVLSALVPNDSFYPRWVRYVNVKGDVEHEYVFTNCTDL